MSQKNYFFYFMFMGAFVLILPLTSGCARYKARPLKILRSATPEKQEAHVSLAYKVFDKNDCKTYLGRPVTRKGFQPVQVTINNKSNHYICFSPSNMSFQTISAAKVARKMHFCTAGYFFGYLFGGPLVWAGACLTTGWLLNIITAHQYSFDLVIGGFLFCAVLSPLFLIPGFVAGYKSMRANYKLDRDYAQKTLSEQIIPPYSYLNGLVFVSKKEFNPDFSLMVADQETHIEYMLSPNNLCVDIAG